MRFGRLLAPWLGFWLTGCAMVDFTRPGTPQAPLATLDTYFAEFCAVSQILQKPGSAATIRGDIGGHSVFFLHGACRAGPQGQTRIQLCDDPGAEPADGVGLSMNAHFASTKWVATPGRDFFLNGNLPEGAPLTRAGHAAVMAEAKRLRLYEGVTFHPEFFANMPPGISREDWVQEISVATDYGISLGRGRFCAKVPVNRAQMAAMVQFLNDENAPYRDRGETFRWNLFKDNCIHLAHNALAAAGLWREWPTNRPFLVSVLDFPVPRNEFVNLMQRVGDAGLLDPYEIHADPALRRALLAFNQLPIQAGALMASRPPQTPNEVYETDLKLIFYDAEFIGPYQGWFDAIQADATQHDPRRNLVWATAQQRLALARRQPLAWWLAQPGIPDRDRFATTYHRFYALLEHEVAAAEPLPARTDVAVAP
jgi:hypothetical protein